ncbi:MAG: CHASE3 domain-containing protein [Pseudonocardiaceae bacterium]
MTDPAFRWSLRRWLWLVGAVCLSVALAAIAARALALTQLSEARTVLVDQLDPALLGAQPLSVALVNQETGVRGCTITGNRDFLVPYQQGRRQEDAVLATLRRLAIAEPRPELTTGLDEVLARARAWRTDYTEPTIAGVSASGQTRATVDPSWARPDSMRSGSRSSARP